MIKDSGDRREFETGAVRDMQEGKGRCDLLPLDVIADYIADPVLYWIDEFQSHKDDVGNLWEAIDVFAYKVWGSSGDTGTKRLANALLEVAKHFEEGAKKYGENNWKKGLPVYCYIDSAVRHYLKWLRGDTDEPHDRAVVWNLLCCIWTVKHKEDKAG